MRPISIETGIMRHAEGSCLISCGDTRVLCSASIEEKAPPFLKGSGQGWVTAEYGMLPRATNSRNRREAAAGKQSGRTQEIQRLIGRALRAGVDRRALGERQGVALGLMAIAAACGVRAAWPTTAGLFASAAMIGVGVAAVQALMPGFIKRTADKGAPRLMALYTTGIMAGAAVAAALSTGLTRLAGWQAMFGLWALPAVLALLLWMRAARPEAAAPAGGPITLRRQSVWKSPRAWLLLTFFGIGTGAYTLVLAWFPPFYASRGLSAEQAGYALAALTVCEVLAGLTVSALIARRPDRRPLLAAALASLLAGLACILWAPSLVPLAVCLLGAGIGAIFPLSLIVTLDHATDPESAGDLMAFVQGGGYVMASVMPFLAGWVRDASSDLSGAWLAMAVGVVAMMAMTTRFRPGARVG